MFILDRKSVLLKNPKGNKQTPSRKQRATPSLKPAQTSSPGHDGHDGRDSSLMAHETSGLDSEATGPGLAATFTMAGIDQYESQKPAEERVGFTALS
jgi:hypothetical protein